MDINRNDPEESSDEEEETISDEEVEENIKSSKCSVSYSIIKCLFHMNFS